MKISLFKFDEDVFIAGIKQYETKMGRAPIYIVMNESTFDVLKLKYCYLRYVDTPLYSCQFFGITVAICNNLQHGEVDIV